MRCYVVASSFCASALGLLLASAPAQAAEFTDLLDAADDFDDFQEDTYDPFDFHIEPSFRFDISSAQITREAPCVPDLDRFADEPAVFNNPRVVEDEGRCSEPSMVFNREMLYEHTRSTMDVELRAGLYKDLELHLTVPYVINSARGLKYDNESNLPGQQVDETNSSVDPSNARVEQRAGQVFDDNMSIEEQLRAFDQYNVYRFFDLSDDHRQIERSGFADPTIGIAWAPFNDQRDDTKATLLFGMDYTMPIAPVKEADDKDVGEGKHVLHWKIASSKRFDWIEPYFGIEYFLPIAASDSPIRKVDSQNEGQVFTNPPMRGDVTIGTEFIPYQNDETGERYAIDLRFTMGYVSEGRDYTPLYDHMVNSDCNRKTVADVLPKFENGQLTNPEDVACAWIVQRPGNADPNPVYDLASMSQEDRQETLFRTDGIMTVEDYGTFAGQVGFYLQPSRYFQLNAIAQLKHRQEHFLTNARTGRDIDNDAEETDDDTVDLTGSDAQFERNPVYNPTYDSSGNRFRIQEYNTWSFIVNAALQF
ncbi:hypothetical protein FIV42_04195 [Persicimonas caeni]|uniref:Uncharacterized protein n=1 Tax=Persicimonas caeni TaxID=2292766 RepID=A0A4Y6PPN7_PERCE|nr:hypothetical protein [Persicimonas caeni]QDG49967.1 hypothetical protein FIV42_04195 [Persicimonas caeni]QED31188.1 hypothetical protein FRD00_04190 [Persicimonas caeni]